MSAALADLNFLPYLDDAGQISHECEGKVGVYAIFDAEKNLHFIGYSRDVALSLKQHLVRQPNRCYWVKVHLMERPNRTALEAIREAWIAEYGTVPAGNSTDESLWTQPVNARAQMTPAEQTAFDAGDELGKIKTLKQVARRVEAEILQLLEQRGSTIAIRFDPKLKEEGLLSIK